jgi:hypothetical protein
MYNAIPIKYSVFPDNSNPIFGEGTTHISIDDDAAGGYIVLEQFPDEGEQNIRLDIAELEKIIEIAKNMMAEYDNYEND